MSEERKASNCLCMGVGPAATRAVKECLPAEAGKHFHAARIEFLKGIRALIDSRIEQLSKDARRQDTGTTVPVE